MSSVTISKYLSHFAVHTNPRFAANIIWKTTFQSPSINITHRRRTKRGSKQRAGLSCLASPNSGRLRSFLTALLRHMIHSMKVSLFHIEVSCSHGMLMIKPILPADPDEFANFRNNAAYTNAGISVVLKNAIQLAGKLGITVPKNWTTISNKITVLSDNSSGIVLEYGKSDNVDLGCCCTLTCRRWFQWDYCRQAGRRHSMKFYQLGWHHIG
jgi:hypothetical protein